MESIGSPLRKILHGVYLREAVVANPDHVKLNRLACLTAALLGTLTSCFPKAIVVDLPVPAKKQDAVVTTPTDPTPSIAPRVASDEGPRLPGNLLDMPGEGEFKATNPVDPKTDNSGAVISHPPTDPPSRVKPKDPKPE